MARSPRPRSRSPASTCSPAPAWPRPARSPPSIRPPGSGPSSSARSLGSKGRRPGIDPVSGGRRSPESGVRPPGGRYMTESLDSRRLDLVRAAQQQWIAALTDLGGRNTLLYYKDRRASTLDLAQADPEAVDRFTGTGSIRLTRLFKDVDLRADAIRRMQAIHRKARELVEERGIRAGYLATGMARWDELFLQPAAPVLLRGLTVTPTRARYDDFELILDDEEEVNPVLVHKLTSVFGAELTKLTPANAVDRLSAAAGDRHLHLRQTAHGQGHGGGRRPAGRKRPGRRHRGRPGGLPIRSSRWSA